MIWEVSVTSNPKGTYDSPAPLLYTVCHAKSLHCVRLRATPWTVTHQAPLSMGFSRQEYWSGLPCCPPEDLPDPGIEPTSLKFSALAGMFFTLAPHESQDCHWSSPAYAHIPLSSNLFCCLSSFSTHRRAHTAHLCTCFSALCKMIICLWSCRENDAKD